ncbi:MAG TPA: enoyl-CoA hydratase-related protein [Mycobacteriales bacterium]|nr:enoyl-CoA hydratase-related protein [Mycobacteriales bacterium]
MSAAAPAAGDFESLSVSIDDGIAIVTLDRPETRNVISDEPIVSELPAACAAFNADPSIRAVVLTGAGSAFSAGGNVRKMLDREGMFAGSPAEIAAAYRSGIQTLIRAVHGLAMPSVAAVNGPAIGAGFDLALACDLRLAARTAKFGETFVTLGLVAGDGGSWLLPRVVGEQRAAELAFTGRVIDADEAVRLGVVLDVYDADALLPAALDLARTIASQPGLATRYTKRLLRNAQTGSFDEVLDAAAEMQAELHGTAEHLAAVQALIDRQQAAKRQRAQQPNSGRT